MACYTSRPLLLFVSISFVCFCLVVKGQPSGSGSLQGIDSRLSSDPSDEQIASAGEAKLDEGEVNGAIGGHGEEEEEEGRSVDDAIHNKPSDPQHELQRRSMRERLIRQRQEVQTGGAILDHQTENTGSELTTSTGAENGPLESSLGNSETFSAAAAADQNGDAEDNAAQAFNLEASDPEASPHGDGAGGATVQLGATAGSGPVVLAGRDEDVKLPGPDEDVKINPYAAGTTASSGLELGHYPGEDVQGAGLGSCGNSTQATHDDGNMMMGGTQLQDPDHHLLDSATGESLQLNTDLQDNAVLIPDDEYEHKDAALHPLQPHQGADRNQRPWNIQPQPDVSPPGTVDLVEARRGQAMERGRQAAARSQRPWNIQPQPDVSPPGTVDLAEARRGQAMERGRQADQRHQRPWNIQPQSDIPPSDAVDLAQARRIQFMGRERRDAGRGQLPWNIQPQPDISHTDDVDLAQARRRPSMGRERRTARAFCRRQRTWNIQPQPDVSLTEDLEQTRLQTVERERPAAERSQRAWNIQPQPDIPPTDAVDLVQARRRQSMGRERRASQRSQLPWNIQPRPDICPADDVDLAQARRRRSRERVTRAAQSFCRRQRTWNIQPRPDVSLTEDLEQTRLQIVERERPAAKRSQQAWNIQPQPDIPSTDDVDLAQARRRPSMGRERRAAQRSQRAWNIQPQPDIPSTDDVDLAQARRRPSMGRERRAAERSQRAWNIQPQPYIPPTDDVDLAQARRRQSMGRERQAAQSFCRQQRTWNIQPRPDVSLTEDLEQTRLQTVERERPGPALPTSTRQQAGNNQSADSGPQASPVDARAQGVHAVAEDLPADAGAEDLPPDNGAQGVHAVAEDLPADAGAEDLPPDNGAQGVHAVAEDLPADAGAEDLPPDNGAQDVHAVAEDLPADAGAEDLPPDNGAQGLPPEPWTWMQTLRQAESERWKLCFFLEFIWSVFHYAREAEQKQEQFWMPHLRTPRLLTLAVIIFIVFSTWLGSWL